MPIERKTGAGGFRYGSSGGSGGGSAQSPFRQLYGSFHTPVPTVQQTSQTRNQRQPSPIERLDLGFAEYAPSIFRAPAVVAERPVAFADAATGGGVSGFLKGVGDFGGDKGGPGPIGSFFKALGDGITATDTAARAWANSGYAEQIAKYAHLGDNTPTDYDTGGWLFGLGSRKMTVGEMKAEIDKRGWRTTEAGTLSWEELQAKARDNRFQFGDRAMTTSVATDALASMVISPTNALFFIPGAGWAAAGSKIAGASSGALHAVEAARWAKPIVTAVGETLRGARYGFGYLKDPAIAALRSPQVVDTTIAARELLAGSTKHASVRALLTAADTVLRGGQIVGKGLGKFAGYKAPANPSMFGNAAAIGSAYYRGALRLQVGSVAAEFAAGRAAQDAEGTIFEGLTNTVHTALQNVNNARPLSDNESFMIFALTTMPMIPLLHEAVTTPGRAISKAVGDQDAIILAKELGYKDTNELFTKAGDGDAARGREVIEWGLQQAERGMAWKELGLATRELGSFDAVVTNNQVLNGIIGGKIRRMREAGQLRSNARVQTFLDVPRKGAIVNKVERPFEWNASPDAIVKSWSRFHQAWTAIAPGAQKLGITALTTSKLVTKEMMDDALQVLLKDAPEAGVVPGWVRDDLLIHMPGLLDDPKSYGDFWQRLAVHSETKPTSGRAFADRARPDTRITMEELRNELTKLRDVAPSAQELFHEAGIMEKYPAGGVQVDALAGSKLRRVHSPAVIKQLRDDTTGKMRAMRQEEKVLSHIRNTEFTRNGKPRMKTVDTTVGYRGTVFHKAIDGEDLPDLKWIGADGVERKIEDYFANENGFAFWFDPHEPTHFNIGMIEDSVESSEALVKAVELGGRTLVSFIDSDNMQGAFLARHGFVEVARKIEEQPPTFLGVDGRTINWERKVMNDGSEAWVDPISGLIGGETSRATGFYAYVGGDPTKLRNKIGAFEGPTEPVSITDAQVGRVIGTVEVPMRPERIPADLLVKFREIDREATPKYADDAGHLDRLFDEIDKTKVDDVFSINTKTGQSVKGPRFAFAPVTLEYDMLAQRALLTDGNHRLAVALRLQKKYGIEIDLPVEIKVISNSFRENEGISVTPQNSRLITAADLVGLIRSEFSPYKPTNRIVKSHQGGMSLATSRSNRASLLVPTTEAIGPSPTSAEGLFHGSSSVFDEFDNDMLSSASLVGRGVYTTNDLGVAIGYAGQGRGHIYRVEPRADLKTYDLMKEFGEDDWELRSELYDALNEDLGIETKIVWEDYDSPQAAIDDMIQGTDIKATIVDDGGASGWPTVRFNGDRASLKKMLEEAGFDTDDYSIVNEAGDVNDKSGFDLFHRIFNSMAPEEIGPINDALIEVFKRHGYEGFTHTGGLLVGNKEHAVTVAFDAKDVAIKERVNPKDFIPATTARHELITQRMAGVRNEMKKQMREIELIDQRAAELRTIVMPENLADHHVPKSQQDELINLISEMRSEYPAYDLAMDHGAAFFDPSDGLIPGINLERTAAQHMLFDYGPMSKISAFYNSVLGPLSSKRLSKMARNAVYTRMLTEGATTKQTGQILAELNKRVTESTVGPLRVPWFRDITSLPAQQVNTIAREILDEKTWANIESRYGREGFHHLLDESANEFVRRVDKNAQRGLQNGQLASALREGYRMWSYAPIVGSGSRLVSKQFYHIFRFMLDVRWHFLNLLEADILSVVREGTTRFGKAPSETSKAALAQHSNRAGLSEQFFTKTPTAGDAGPSSAMELFDVGLYLHNRNILPIITKNFEKSRFRSVDKVLDELPKSSSLHRMLEERFGQDQRTWSKQLDDMMYDFDSKGVRETVYATARKDGWTEDEIVHFGGLLERITELNQKSYDDIVGVYSGNLDRTRLERVLNSYWLYWPISYQIKASKWMFNALMNRWGGVQTNMTGLYLFNNVAERYKDLLANNTTFQQEMEDNEDLWFAVNMLFPASPLDIGTSLNRGVRYVTSLVAPEVIPPYIGIDGAEDIPTRMLEMGPVYSAKFLQTIINEAKKGTDNDHTVVEGQRVEGPLVRNTP